MDKTYLSSDSMTSRREELGNTGSLKARFRKPKSSSQTSSSCTTVVIINFSIEEKLQYDTTYTTIASYSCSISGYFPEAHDYESKVLSAYRPQNMNSTHRNSPRL